MGDDHASDQLILVEDRKGVSASSRIDGAVGRRREHPLPAHQLDAGAGDPQRAAHPFGHHRQQRCGR